MSGFTGGCAVPLKSTDGTLSGLRRENTMKKDEIFDLIVKGFGVYLLVLAIMAIPEFVKGIASLAYCLCSLPSENADAVDKISTALKGTYISSGLGALVKFAIYLAVSINFLRSGSLARMIMKDNTLAEPSAGGDGNPASQQ